MSKDTIKTKVMKSYPLNLFVTAYPEVLYKWFIGRCVTLIEDGYGFNELHDILESELNQKAKQLREGIHYVRL